MPCAARGTFLPGGLKSGAMALSKDVVPLGPDDLDTVKFSKKYSSLQDRMRAVSLGHLTGTELQEEFDRWSNYSMIIFHEVTDKESIRDSKLMNEWYCSNSIKLLAIVY